MNLEEMRAIYFLLIILAIIILVIRIPIIIAKNRGISGSELTTIAVLSWVSLLLGLTWFIALVLSLVWQPKNWVDKQQEQEGENRQNFNTGDKLTVFETLEKLNALKEKGIITDSEFQKEKGKILQNL